LTASTTRNIIQIDLRTHDAGGRHQIGTLAGFGSEQVAGFILECMAGFVGIRMDEDSELMDPSIEVSFRATAIDDCEPAWRLAGAAVGRADRPSANFEFF
jgi:hypothetical protein